MRIEKMVMNIIRYRLTISGIIKYYRRNNKNELLGI